MNEEKNYDDIINLPHHVSVRHPQMSALDRAAQFSPFAALTGHEDAITETARLTRERIEQDENSREILDRRLQMVIERIRETPEITVTYFQQDARKQGGEYLTVSGRVKKVDEYERRICLEYGAVLRIEEIVDIEVDILGDEEIVKV